MYNILSPDNFPISIENFKTKKQALNYFETKWKKQFEKQGYYSSSVYGRIELNDLANYCQFTNCASIKK
jgi:hypothetical protein